MGVRLQLSVRDKASGGGLARVAIRAGVRSLLDAESRQPMGRFQVYLLDANNLQFAPGSGSRDVFFGHNGRYDFELTNPDIRGVRIEAERYESRIFKLHLQGNEPVELNFLLQKQQRSMRTALVWLRRKNSPPPESSG
jgi:hypothetical protein